MKYLVTALLLTCTGVFGWACAKVGAEADRRTDEHRPPCRIRLLEPYDWEDEE